jgi:hypothetical protein
MTDKGIGRRVEPGRLNIYALTVTGALTTEACDGSSVGQVIMRRTRPVLTAMSIARRENCQ